ncbi:MAG: hypothetical protein IMW90_15095 [Thermogemmatispora sp.]|uniref:hypothetical protein n=1 Tax=Thermogemmatispora sp. TaxID=1968838 RepID=UPI001A10443D|nr:hypothetical protein [Thermogemmatispora sp.]MBE3567044.1 hypothetical protein [Thermogemmatispora sp.]
MNFGELVQSSILARALALIIGCVIILLAAIAGFIEIIEGQQINQYILLVIGTGLGYALQVLGLTTGIVLSPSLPSQGSPQPVQQPAQKSESQP